MHIVTKNATGDFYTSCFSYSVIFTISLPLCTVLLSLSGFSFRWTEVCPSSCSDPWTYYPWWGLLQSHCPLSIQKDEWTKSHIAIHGLNTIHIHTHTDLHSIEHAEGCVYTCSYIGFCFFIWCFPIFLPNLSPANSHLQASSHLSHNNYQPGTVKANTCFVRHIKIG